MYIYIYIYIYFFMYDSQIYKAQQLIQIKSIWFFTNLELDLKLGYIFITHLKIEIYYTCCMSNNKL